MIAQYLNGNLKGVQLAAFEQGLYAYTFPDDVVIISSFDFQGKSTLELMEMVEKAENQLKNQDFFFIGQLKRRDRRAQKRLYRKLQPKFKNHILKNSGSDADVLDMLQEVIEKLYEKLRGEETNITTVEGFAFGIMRNYWRKELKKRKRRDEEETAYGQQQEVSYINELDEEEEDCKTRILLECMEQLKPAQREFLIYYDLQGHSVKETALHFEMTERSVRVRAVRCREYLKEKMEKHPDYEECFKQQ